MMKKKTAIALAILMSAAFPLMAKAEEMAPGGLVKTEPMNIETKEGAHSMYLADMSGKEEMPLNPLVETEPMNIITPKEAAKKKAGTKADEMTAEEIRKVQETLISREKPDPGPGTEGAGSGLFPMAFPNGERETVEAEGPNLFTIDEALSLPVADQGEITVAGGIIAHEKDHIYILSDGGERRLRADLGKYGGRLILRTFFTASGHMTADEKGPLFVAKSIQYKDPVAHIKGDEPFDWLGKKGKEKQRLKLIRDPAFDHWPNGSDLGRYMVNHPEAASRADEYPLMSAADAMKAEKGTKIRIKGRAISTRTDGYMNFWDENMDNVILDMDGNYIPLGQHCTILGIKEDGFVRVVHMVSLAEAGPGLDIPEI